MSYDQFYSSLYGDMDQLDWCSEDDENFTPQQRPYSYSAHYTWRDFDKNDIPADVGSVYSDRMREWDTEVYTEATKGLGWIENISKSQAKKLIKTYYGGKYECVGFAKTCNVSNGYGLGIFFIREKKKG